MGGGKVNHSGSRQPYTCTGSPSRGAWNGRPAPSSMVWNMAGPRCRRVSGAALPQTASSSSKRGRSSSVNSTCMPGTTEAPLRTTMPAARASAPMARTRRR